ncbi:MAG: ATP-binding cassette domain-containing protein [Clostridia bacterium]|nr:ATP-binding cassette domain-containing protein [Clostridia bacterium]
MSIQFHCVSFSYDKTPVLQEISWRLPDTGVVCLWGPSGCGKTTLLRLLAGLEKPTAGAVEGLDAKRVSVVFQEDRLLPWLTALENVMLPGTGEKEAKEMLTRLGLEDVCGVCPSSLSGGQQRRVALARALAAPCDLLLLDEPFNGLDEGTWQDILPLISQKARACPVVLVTHVRAQAEGLQAQVVSLSNVPISGFLSFETDKK